MSQALCWGHAPPEKPGSCFRGREQYPESSNSEANLLPWEGVRPPRLEDGKLLGGSEEGLAKG